MLLAKGLPGLVVADYLTPPPGDLRGAHEGLGVVNELQYLRKKSVTSPHDKILCRPYPEAYFVGQLPKGVLFQPWADDLVQQA